MSWAQLVSAVVMFSQDIYDRERASRQMCTAVTGHDAAHPHFHSDPSSDGVCVCLLLLKIGASSLKQFKKLSGALLWLNQGFASIKCLEKMPVFCFYIRDFHFHSNIY